VIAPTYRAPRSLEEAIAVLGALGPEATVVAGGQDVVPLMNQGRLAPRHIVDISRLGELRGIIDGETVTLGALTTYADLARHVALGAALPLLIDALRQMGGGLQVRNRGTVGGAVCAALPAYDLPACLLALEAVFVLAGEDGVRRVPASAFFLDAGRTARRAAELLTAIEFPPLPGGARYAYVKLKFSEGGYTIAGAACVLVMAGDGACREARLAVSGVSRVPRRQPAAEASLRDLHVRDAGLDAMAARVEEAVTDPIEDVMATGAYRRAMAGVMARRAVVRAVGR
jgi:CO/xanthine dehydrogenase FAD-binding subunit